MVGRQGYAADLGRRVVARVFPFLARKKKRPIRAKKNSPSLLAKEGIKKPKKISA